MQVGSPAQSGELRIFYKVMPDGSLKWDLQFDSRSAGFYRLVYEWRNVTSNRQLNEPLKRLRVNYAGSNFTFSWADIPRGFDVTSSIFHDQFILSVNLGGLAPGVPVEVDPYLVGSSSFYWATSTSQRRVFYDPIGGYYWVFYDDGSGLTYRYSSDGKSWNQGCDILGCGCSGYQSCVPGTFNNDSDISVFGQNVIVAKGGQATVSSYPGDVKQFLYLSLSVSYLIGTISGSNISWSSLQAAGREIVFCLPNCYSLGAGIRDVSVYVAPTGRPLFSYNLWYNYYPSNDTDTCPQGGSTTYSYSALKVSYVNGTGYWKNKEIFNDNNAPLPSGQEGYCYRFDQNDIARSIILPSDSQGGFRVLYQQPTHTYGSSAPYSVSNSWVQLESYLNATGSVETIPGNIYNLGASTSPPGGLGSPEFSAVADGDYGTHVVYRASSGTVTYQYRPVSGSWTGSTDLFTGQASDPTISVDYSNNDVYAFALQGSAITMRVKRSGQSWTTQTLPVTGRTNNPQYLGSSYSAASGTASGRISLVWTETNPSAYSVEYAGIPIMSAWSPFASPTDPWDGNGIVPFGEYFANLGESVSPSNGMLTLSQTDLSVPGRGLSLEITRNYVEPYSLWKGNPYNYESYPWAPLGNGWQLNFPWLNYSSPLYIHLWNGEGYRIPASFWNGGSGTFENHQGESFLATRNAGGIFLNTTSAITYRFDPNNYRLTSITDSTGNRIQLYYNVSNQIGCVLDTLGRGFNFSYSNGLLQSIGEYSGCHSSSLVRTVLYNYSGQNLVSVTDPAGRITSYLYQAGPWLLTRVTYPTGWYTNFTFAPFRLGTEDLVYSWRVSHQTVLASTVSQIRRFDYSYTQGTGDEVTSSEVKTYNGTSLTGYTDYAFSYAGMVRNVSDANHSLVSGVQRLFDGRGEVITETFLVTDGGSPPKIGSYTNTYRYDLWGNRIYSHTIINPTTNVYHDSFGAFYNDKLPLGFYYFADTFSDRNGQATDNAGWTMRSFCLPCPAQNPVQTMNATNGWLHFHVIGTLGFNFYSPQLPIAGSYSHWNVAFNWKAGSDVANSTVPNLIFSLQTNHVSLEISPLARPGMGTSQAGSYSADLASTINSLINPPYNATWVELNWNIKGESFNNGQTGDLANVMVSTGTNFSNAFLNGSPGPSIHRALAGAVEYQNGTGTLPIETYCNYSSWGGLLSIKQRYDTSSGTQWPAISYTYDQFGNPSSVTNTEGNRTYFTYSSRYQNAYLTNVTQRVIPGNVQTTRLYNYDVYTGNKLSQADPNGSNTTYKYDVLGRVTRVVYPLSLGYVNFTYNDSANYVNVTNENGWKTQQIYDGLGRLVATKRYAGGNVYSTDSYAYNWLDKPAAHTDPLTNSYSYTYDVLGRQLVIGEPTGYFVSQYYNDTGSWLRVTDEGGNYRCNVYDRLGRIVSVIEAASQDCQSGTVTNYHYDEVGNLRSVTNANGKTTSYTYDSLNRLTLSKYADGTNETYAYDNDGNMVSKLDRKAVQTSYYYDSLNRISIIGYHGPPWGSNDLYTYDKAGNLLQLTSTNATISYTYDARNRVTNECYWINSQYTPCPPYTGGGGGNGGSVAAGTLIRLANGTQIPVQNIPVGAQVIAYNAPTGYQTTATVSQASIVVTNSTLTIQTTAGLPFRADANPKMKLWVLTPGGAVEKPITLIQPGDRVYNYNLGSWVNVTDVKATYGGQHTMYDLAITPAFTSNGLLLEYIANGYPDCYNICKQGPTGLGPTTPSGGVSTINYTITYTYSGENLNSINYHDGHTVNYTYDTLGRTTTVSIGSTTLATFSYYPNDQTKGMTFGNGLLGNYSYDSLSRASNITLANGKKTTLSLVYGYSNTGTVSGITGTINSTSVNEQYSYDSLQRLTGASVSPTNFSYGYDNVGNRVYQNPNSTAGIQYVYNRTNNELMWANNFPTGWTTHYHYDLNGNLVSKIFDSNSWSYNWDVPGHLLSTSLNGVIQSYYAYDGMGRRVESMEGSTIFYAYLGTDTLQERYANGTINDYVYAAGLRIGRVRGAATLYYHNDALGSTRLMSDSNKNLVFSDNYQPFGQDNTTPKGFETYKFTGKPVSQTTGLYYYGARWYDPTIGRFISQDPDPGARSNPQSLNPYIYAFDQPTGITDPSGMDGCWVFSWACNQVSSGATTAWSGLTTAGTDIQNGWNSLSPEEQQGLMLAGFVALTVATGGTDLLVIGAVGAVAATAAYVGTSYAAGNTPTLAGALTYANLGFALTTGVYAFADPAPEIDVAARLAANRGAGLAFESDAADILGFTRNIGAGRTVLQGTETAGRAIPDYVGATFYGEAKFTQGSIYATRQIRIMIEAAGQQGKDLALVYAEGTRIAPTVFRYASEFGVRIIRFPI